MAAGSFEALSRFSGNSRKRTQLLVLGWPSHCGSVCSSKCFSSRDGEPDPGGRRRVRAQPWPGPAASPPTTRTFSASVSSSETQG